MWKVVGCNAYGERVKLALRHLSPIALYKVEIRENAYPFAHVSGLKEPKIVLSTGLLDILDDEELLAVLAHEQGHICGRDNYLNLTFLLKELSFFSPFSHASYHSYMQAREESADMAATTGLPERRLALASALVKVAQQAQELVALTRLSFLHSSLTGVQSITRRVEILIGEEAKFSKMSPVLPIAFLLALVLLIC